MQGVFSLALPHRTGAQCRAFYRQSKFCTPGEESASTPLAAIRACLEHHKPIIATLWTSPVAQQVESRVNAALQGAPSANQPIIPPFRQPALGNEAYPSTKQAIAQLQGHTLQKLPQKPSLPAVLAHNSVTVPSNGSTSISRQSTPANLNKLPLAPVPPNQNRGAAPVHKRQKVQKSVAHTAGSKILPQSTTQKPSLPNGRGPKSLLANRVEVNKQKSNRNFNDSEESEDEFVAGTLRKIKAIPTSTTAAPTKPSSRTPIDHPSESTTGSSLSTLPKGRFKGGPRQHPLRGRRGRSTTVAVSASGDAHVGDSEAAAAAGIERLTILRLDKDQKLPGWGRQVLPYTPLLQNNNKSSINSLKNPDALTTITFDHGGQIVHTPSILSFDFATLGQGNFLGVIINAPLSADPNHGITAGQLACIDLSECLAGDAIVCIWASKEHVAEAVGCMAKVWGCKYVENLTWVHLSPNGDVARAPAPLTRASHATLLMGRRGGGDLELRHQRNPDVIVQPAMGNGRFPDAVREMLETLLPEPKHAEQGEKKSAAGGDRPVRTLGSPRFLEVAFHGAEPEIRPGWVKLVQTESDKQRKI